MTTTVVLATAAAVALAGCSSSGGSKKKSGGGLNGGSSSSGSSGGAAQNYTIGFIGALSGSNAQLGINERNGAQLAIDQANASGKYKFKVTLLPADSEGDPAKAPAAATQLISNAKVIGVIGPAFSGESKAVDPSFCKASPPMPIVTASASEGDLQSKGYTCWHRIIPNDNVEGTQGADWLARTGSKNVFVLDDQSAYGQGVAGTMGSELKKKGVKVQTGSINGMTTTNYRPIAQKIANSGADAVFYGGYDAQAALLAKALTGAGFKGRRVTGNGGKSSIFTKNAGTAGNGWYFTCGCQDATVAPGAKAFAAAYQAKFKTAPSTYSPEAFDVANLFIDSINKASSSGPVTRTSLLTALNAENYKGITTTIKFQSNGEVEASNLVVNLFRQESGVIKGLGDINQAK
ncbi:branched-chain amino acid ABC transporter substrate-binding protein [uncultured Jatrophihabitans sp.]|uniref:branched-chain amino acid ABC transporter substrate-binding protein n=1 Tax=uncultured Jatrophihabitans sp. TaxID=1610747 RepID=UPI0035CA0857